METEDEIEKSPMFARNTVTLLETTRKERALALFPAAMLFSTAFRNLTEKRHYRKGKDVRIRGLCICMPLSRVLVTDCH